jgi:peptide/nickel transport system substrate-binding protein
MKNKKPLLVLIFSLLVIAMVIFPACTGDSAAPTTGDSQTPATTEPTEPVSYTIADSWGDWGFPSPYAHYSRGPGYVRMQYIFETLAWKDDKGFVPQLATDWEYVPEDNAYIFNLQDNVKWHDGTDFTADDVVFTFNYTKDHPYQWVDNSIVESVEALDNNTVKLYLSKPYAPFFQDVAGSQPIFPRHIWENIDNPEEFLEPDALIGTGPYTLADYNKEQGTYLYKANDNYYLGDPIVDEIKIVKISPQMNPAALKEGTVNAASIPPEVVSDMEAGGFTILIDPPSWNNKLTINHKKEPLSHKEFRQALAYAIDREAMVDIVMRGEAIVGSPGMMPPTSVWYNPDIPQYNYDAEKAQQLIEGLGYKLVDGYFMKDGKPLELELITAADYKDEAQFITQALEDIGIKIELRTLEGETVDNKVAAWDFDLSLYGHGGLFEPSVMQRLVVSEGFNSSRYTENEELTQILNDQLTEMDTDTRKEMIAQAQQLYAEDVPALTLYYHKDYWAIDDIVDLYFTSDGIAIGVPIPLNRMCFVK